MYRFGCAITCPAILLLFACAAARPLYASTLIVRPYEVCTPSVGCGDVDQQLFVDETEKIWSQADIAIQFLAWDIVTAPEVDYSNLGGFDALEALSPYQSDSPKIVWMWFVPQITTCGGAGGTIYGCSLTPGDQVAISNYVFTYSSVGRLDTIAHELGHSLGLDDCSDCDPDNLEAIGNIRDVPQSLGDIYPNGAGDDQLTATQIVIADRSPLLFPSESGTVPEPATLLLTAVGALGLWLRVRRMKIAG